MPGADGDVLHPDQAGAPALGHEDVEQHHHEHREPGLPDDEVHRTRRVRGEEHHDRQRDPQPGVVAAHRRHHERRPRRSRCNAPTSACSAVAPVPSAFERSTDSAASTTQNACSTEVVFATSTARASPSAARAALRNRTDRRLQCAGSTCQRVGDRSPRRRARDRTRVVRGGVGVARDLQRGEREAPQRERGTEAVDDACRAVGGDDRAAATVRAPRCARRGRAPAHGRRCRPSAVSLATTCGAGQPATPRSRRGAAPYSGVGSAAGERSAAVTRSAERQQAPGGDRRPRQGALARDAAGRAVDDPDPGREAWRRPRAAGRRSRVAAGRRQRGRRLAQHRAPRRRAPGRAGAPARARHGGDAGDEHADEPAELPRRRGRLDARRHHREDERERRGGTAGGEVAAERAENDDDERRRPA